MRTDWHTAESRISGLPIEQDLVSIITIFLNGMEFFDDTMASVFDQTYTKWEWLLIDDGSSEECSERARRLEAQHPGDLRYYCHDKRQNLGMSASRNLGLAHAKGEYIALLDIDDVWSPGKLTAQTEVLRRHPEVAMAYGPLLFWYSWTGREADKARDFISGMGDEYDIIIEPPAALLRQIRIGEGLPGPCSVTLRSAAVRGVGGWEDSFTGMYEDEVFFSKICMRYPTYLMADRWDLYRQHENSFSAICARSGEYVPGPALPSRSRYGFLKWLHTYARKMERDEVADLVQAELSKYTQF